MNIEERIIGKMFSGRFIATTAIIITYCASIIVCLFLTAKKLMELETFLGVFAGFSGLATFVIKSYFDDKKRPHEAIDESDK